MPLESKSPSRNTEATLKIPFETPRHAEIAFRVLSVDQEPRRNFVSKDLRLVENNIEVHFIADQVKNLRTAITSFFESLLLCTDTIKSFDLETIKNAGTHSSPNTS
ncbi:uncharacterized protein LOC119601517 [Lucilia sericata]|uniref:uncharacterized protein LOC119601517 n=1 Tax=Lucilia sericata TaxID=13632 RepID=UPI0018A87478|nr:uncharacterized protein LOC119601517 [Lucilia sericata]